MTKKIPVWAMRVQALRKGKGLSLKLLAASANVGDETLRNIEAGRSPNLRTLEKLAKALGTTSADLVKV